MMMARRVGFATVTSEFVSIRRDLAFQIAQLMKKGGQTRC